LGWGTHGPRNEETFGDCCPEETVIRSIVVAIVVGPNGSCADVLIRMTDSKREEKTERKRETKGTIRF
jgi:hypothetical protein